ncbi:MAG TPA: pitrilysin family protein [Terriglobia bacterium]|nr:pitrilysin family protein [Terriglobia bacterium]
MAKWLVRHRGAALVLLVLALPSTAAAQEARLLTVDSSSPLLEVKVSVKAGSALDPEGLEGLGYLTARLLLEGGYGDPKKPVTKEQLAEITRPWGEGAYPRVRVAKEIVTFSFTIPREVFDEYLSQVLRPMITQPLFNPAELDRVRRETLEEIRSNLRFEQLELLGLLALDNVIHDGTSYSHPALGTVQGLEKVTPEAVRRFYRTWYRPDDIAIAVSTKDSAVSGALRGALDDVGRRVGDIEPFPSGKVEPPAAIKGRRVTIIGLPGAIATGLHAGFPIPVTRQYADYWPLYVANVWFGTHRDSFSRLYQVIREERGYNYGDYSYIEHFEGRPSNLFPPTNTPRRYPYFSIWIRPVANEYAHHLLKAMTWELENFVRTGLTAEQVEAAKNKARVLYLSLAENVDRLVGYRLDDEFYGLAPGYLDQYLARIDAVTTESVNKAIREYLQAENVQYVIITDEEVAEKLADDIAADRNAHGKSPKEYQIDSEERDGVKYWLLNETRLKILQQDAVWNAYRLEIPRSNIRVVKAAEMFETAAMPR